MDPVSLTGEQYQQLLDAILKAFNYQTLRQCVRIKLNPSVVLEQVVSQTNLTEQVSQLLDWAERESRLRELVTGLRVCNPLNSYLEAAESAIFGGGVVAATAREALGAAGQVVESQARADPTLQSILAGKPGLPYDVDGQDERWRRAKAAVARVESPDGTPWASGFLVGPDLFLTNNHVRREAKFDTNPKAARIRFGYARVDAVAGYGEVVELAEDWLVAFSPDDMLDYCLVRLKSAVGKRTVGRDHGAPKRGWLVAAADAAKVGDIVTVLGHPKGEALMQAAGVVTAAGATGWLDYTSHTLGGSSGSPVLNPRFELVGLHSREGTSVANRGVAVAAILNHLEEEEPEGKKLLGTTSL